MLFNESPRLFRESILLIFSGELQTNPIQFSHPHFKSFQMSRKVSTNSTADIIQNMTMSCLFVWPIRKKSYFWEIFYQKSSSLYVLWTIKRHFNISSKKDHQSMDSFYSICSKKWIAAEWSGFEIWKLFSSQHKMYVISIQNTEKVLFCLHFQRIFS